jgi:hypothetical protein
VTQLPSSISKRPADHEARMAAAERRAEWELGDRAWAGMILAAYWNPEDDQAALDQEEAA